MFRSGFVSLVGRPNVGKSTLLNALVGQKASIISDKAQTTRNRIRAVLTNSSAQVIFIDTPGIHKPKHRLGSYMVRSARSTFKEVDVILWLADARYRPGRGDLYIIKGLMDVKTPVFLVLNKIDLVPANRRDERLKLYSELYPFSAGFMISALKDRSFEKLMNEIIHHLPEGPRYYPEGVVTDRPEFFLISEIIREKILAVTREEIPFSIAVEVEEFKKREQRDLVDIRAVIHVERNSQKGIVVGKKGGLLKEVGTRARPEIEALLGNQVYLDLWVKVNKDWRNKESALHHLGYREN